MKQANITLKLTKDNHVHLKGVTPIEAMLLVHEHLKAVGGDPIEKVEDEKDTGHFEDIPYEEDEDYVEVKTGPDGKVTKSVATRKVKRVKQQWVKDTVERTVDDEIGRLRMKYAPAKINHILTQVRDMPKTFDEARKKGISIVAGQQSSTLVVHNMK